MNRERQRWTNLASRNPYWAVVSWPEFHENDLDEDAIRRFFESGERHVASVLATVRAHVDPDFELGRALEYGCGVGRIAIPLARVCEHVVAVDISEAMLSETEANCASRAITNIDLARADEFLAAPDDAYSFDFAHSFVVLQHIAPNTGMPIIECILRRLSPGGVGALHVTYADRAGPLRRSAHRLRRRFRLVGAALNLLQGRPLAEPVIPMYEYNLVDLFEVFGRYGCTALHAELTDHSGHLGALFLFRKPG